MHCVLKSGKQLCCANKRQKVTQVERLFCTGNNCIMCNAVFEKANFNRISQSCNKVRKGKIGVIGSWQITLKMEKTNFQMKKKYLTLTLKALLVLKFLHLAMQSTQMTVMLLWCGWTRLPMLHGNHCSILESEGTIEFPPLITVLMGTIHQPWKCKNFQAVGCTNV